MQHLLARLRYRHLASVASNHTAIVQAEKRLLNRVSQLVDPLLDPSRSDLKTIETTIRHLDELFCITVIGEFNSGKSTFVNALLGQKICEEGVTPTTSTVNFIRFEDLGSKSRSSWLHDAVIVDTPGTNAIIAGHQQITEEVIPRSDVVFFLTSIDRPFSESECTFMSKIRQWRRKIVFIINKTDMLDAKTRGKDLEKVINFVRSNSQQQLHIAPPIFAVSGKSELNAKLSGSSCLDSGFRALEAFISETLSDDDKMRLKLENPLGVVERLLDKYEVVLQEKQSNTRIKQNAITKILEELDYSKTRTKSAFRLQTSRVENVLLRLLHRVDDFLAEQLRLSNVPNLVKSHQLARTFERDVICGFVSEVDRLVRDASQWIQDQNAARFHLVASAFQHPYSLKTLANGSVRLVDLSGVKPQLSTERQSFQADVRNQVQVTLQRYQDSVVSKQFTDSVKTTLLASFVLEISAIAALASVATADLGGFVGVVALAIGGLVVLPYKQREVTRQIRQQIIGSQRQLQAILAQHLDFELQRCTDLVKDSLRPIIRQIEIELKAFDSAQDEIVYLRREIESIRLHTNPSPTKLLPSCQAKQ